MMCTVTVLAVVLSHEIVYNSMKSHVQGSLLHRPHFTVGIPTDHWVTHLRLMHQWSLSSCLGFVHPSRSDALGWSGGAVGLPLDVLSYETVCWVLFLILCFCVFLSIAVYKKAELAKKTEVQTHSPSRKIILKPAIKYTRPTHLSCVKRKQTGDCVLFSYAMWLANIDIFVFVTLMAIAASLFFISSSKNINLHK